MRIGAVFPQTEIGSDPQAVRAWAEAVEQLGYTHILAFDHVIGAGTASRPDWRGPYSSATMFHEPFVLFGYLASITRTVELVTDVIILPQRQTALVAKQAAEVDVLSGGRLRLGIGIGWNDVEYQVLNQNFADRGRRSEEQIEVLRALWSSPEITYRGRWHTIEDAGLNPLPPRRTIPIWIGGGVEATLKRVARLGDGWFPQIPPDDRAAGMLEQLRQWTAEAGRDPASIGIEARLSLGREPADRWIDYVDGWRALGATHIGVNTMGCGFTSPDEHISALKQVGTMLGVKG
jgi:probable F420-dependent oxidoreductase